MYASERAVIFETGLKHYTTGCEFLAVICDYSVMFCATSTLYEAAFVTSSLANRLSSCLCLLLCALGEGEITSFDVLDSHATMAETLGTQELLNDARDAHHAHFYSSTPYGDIAERNRYKPRSVPCSVRARTK